MALGKSQRWFREVRGCHEWVSLLPFAAIGSSNKRGSSKNFGSICNRGVNLAWLARQRRRTAPRPEGEHRRRLLHYLAS